MPGRRGNVEVRQREQEGIKTFSDTNGWLLPMCVLSL